MSPDEKGTWVKMYCDEHNINISYKYQFARINRYGMGKINVHQECNVIIQYADKVRVFSARGPDMKTSTDQANIKVFDYFQTEKQSFSEQNQENSYDIHQNKKRRKRPRRLPRIARRNKNANYNDFSPLQVTDRIPLQVKSSSHMNLPKRSAVENPTMSNKVKIK